MTDTSNRPTDPNRIEPTITPPGGVEEPISPAAAGLQGALGRHPVDATVGAARAEEHGAPAPTRKIGVKVWVVAGLVVIVALAALSYA